MWTGTNINEHDEACDHSGQIFQVFPKSKAVLWSAGCNNIVKLAPYIWVKRKLCKAKVPKVKVD